MTDNADNTARENIETDLDLLKEIRKEPLLADCSEEQQRAFARLVKLVEEGQGRLNLTAIRDPLAMVRYHIADSLALTRAAEQFGVAGAVTHAGDVGTGAGFPLLPMAIVWPETDWVGIESVGKKAKFVEGAALALGLGNVDLWAARAEDVGRSEYRGAFDLVTARAVGPVAPMLEVSMPLLKVGGRMYLFKTDAATAEWLECDGVLKELGGRAVGEYKYSLEGDERQRVIFVAEKVGDTPAAYPRAAGVPFKKPLVRLDDGGGRRG